MCPCVSVRARACVRVFPLSVSHCLSVSVSSHAHLITCQLKLDNSESKMFEWKQPPSISKRYVVLTVVLTIGLIVSCILNGYFYPRIVRLENERSELNSRLSNLESEISALSEINDLNTLLKMPDGIDQHYEKTRYELLGMFTDKGSRGRLLFYIMQVLHDIGDYNGTHSCASFFETHNVSCSSLSREFLETLCNFKVQENESLDQIRTVYDWANDYLDYVEDEWEFPRFPVETLVLGYGDCEDQAIVVSAILETLGFETALSTIHDEENDLHHAFCLVKNSAGINYQGTSLQSDDYSELGQIWFVLDPAYGHKFGEDPSWIEYYRVNGQVNIPSSLWNSTIVNIEEFERIRQELGISF